MTPKASGLLPLARRAAPPVSLLIRICLRDVALAGRGRGPGAGVLPEGS